MSRNVSALRRVLAIVPGASLVPLQEKRQVAMVLTGSTTPLSVKPLFHQVKMIVSRVADNHAKTSEAPAQKIKR